VFIVRTFGLVLAALFAVLPAVASAATSPAAWVNAFWPTAKAAGVSHATYDRALGKFTPDPDVVDSAGAQPEFTWTPWDYLEQLVSADRVAAGAAALEKYAPVLAKIEARYGVDRRVIVAIWGIESNYGADLAKASSNKETIRSLATLAYEGGSYGSYARAQLVAALKILDRGDVAPEAMFGSWAGAMGETQFIPTTYEEYAVDFDGDGKRNIWTSVPDALASTANLLAHAGWRMGQAWGYEVAVPAKAPSTTERTLAAWEKLGVDRVKDQDYPRPADRATLYRPNGADGPSFLLLPNFSVIKRYNNSNLYALAVAHLSDRLAGLTPFVTPWPPHEIALSQSEREKLQLLLTMRGAYGGEIDGVLGSGSREAIRSYQTAVGLNPDGLGTRSLLQRLQEGG
jgi:membrane-bound lytic murein transglycosylase B